MNLLIHSIPTNNSLKTFFKQRTKLLLMSLCLILLVLFVYFQVRHFEFLNWDDQLYIGEPQVKAGLNWKGLRWAFSSTDSSNWAPLTLLSHMLDYTLFGDKPGAHHLTSVVLHAANSVLCLHLMYTMTGARWKSALVAAVFALHPCHVESVAWVAERKDVLSTFFLFLTILAYLYYIKSPSLFRYGPLLICFLLGLLTKSMLVTLPLLLLVLDYWPLGRMPNPVKNFWPRLKEKIPLLLLALVIAIIALHTQSNARKAIEKVPILFRFGNAFNSYFVYFKDFFIPLRLAPFYPFVNDMSPLGWGFISVVCIGILLFYAFRYRRIYPFIGVGLAWYLISLLPVIGFIQIGSQSHADRYTYVPYIGIAIPLIWGGHMLSERCGIPRKLISLLVIAWVIALGCLAWQQTAIWSNSLQLWRYTQKLVVPNTLVQVNLGLALRKAGRREEALREYEKAIDIDSSYILGYLGKGAVLADMERKNEALTIFNSVLSLQEDNLEALFHCTRLSLESGRTNEGIMYMRRFLGAEKRWTGKPSRSDFEAGTIIRTELGIQELHQHRWEPASELFREAMARDPEDSAPILGLAKALQALDRKTEAAALLDQFLTLNPGATELRAERAQILSSNVK